ncbi:MAG: hypothetical protein IIZ93_14175 [Acidaminococcaceae bacterium]|nr:hypothetical protein [Acidaminococcaceae bacterium]
MTDYDVEFEEKEYEPEYEKDPSDIAREEREHIWMFGNRNWMDDLWDAKERGLI